MSALLRWIAWRIRCAFGVPAVVDVPGYGMRLYLQPRWKGCWKLIFVFRERFFEVSDPELGFVQRLLKPGEVFVDAGAYQGWYTLTASGIVGEDGLVIAFEPNPDTYADLRRNIALNGRRNIAAFNPALSNEDGIVRLYKDPGDGIASSLADLWGGDRHHDVSARRLDGVLEDLDVRRVDVLKVDVEGSEAALLHGAGEVLRRWRPIVIFEVNPAASLVPLPEYPDVPEGAVLNVVAVPGET